MPPEFEYVGDELELFAKANNWKAYFRARLGRLISGQVLEVGAGIGATTRVFQSEPFTHWTCLEPDPALLNQLQDRLLHAPSSEHYDCRQGTLSSMEQDKKFETILYIDVLEHIQHDKEEINQAAELLSPGGRLIILSPAYQFLFSPFDTSIGHFRRYTLNSLKKLTPKGCEVDQGYYLDSVGLLASLANRLFLKASMPTQRQIAFWDSVLVRCSRIIDWIVLHSVGRSVIVVWKKGNQ